jgi:hypothetical protein
MVISTCVHCCYRGKGKDDSSYVRFEFARPYVHVLGGDLEDRTTSETFSLKTQTWRLERKRYHDQL